MMTLYLLWRCIIIIVLLLDNTPVDCALRSPPTSGRANVTGPTDKQSDEVPSHKQHDDTT